MKKKTDLIKYSEDEQPKKKKVNLLLTFIISFVHCCKFLLKYLRVFARERKKKKQFAFIKLNSFKNSYRISSYVVSLMTE